ncbi:MAG: non-hydrolyzing UDP-N-acetylglucosamine 2-epimerase [Oceanococcus sp.]
MSLKIINVAGARPNFMKIAPIMFAMQEHDGVEPLLVHTGQHYDRAMSDVFFEELGIPKPDFELGVGSGSHAQQTARIMLAFEELCLAQKPDAVLVVGDVNSTLACSVVASKLNIPVAHVEAGLRSGDRKMPEEINRLVTDAISDHLFTTSRDADENLLREGVSKEKIHFVGNVMVDTLLKQKERALATKTVEKLGLQRQGYGLITLHRPSNVDDEVVLNRLLDGLAHIGERIPLVFPIHPRTRQRLADMGEQAGAGRMRNLTLLDPQNYLGFIDLMAGARLVVTDSGGLQEETTVLGVPCLTVRENTERPVTISEGTNTLVGTQTNALIQAADSILNNGGKAGRIPELWDGQSAQRIVRILADRLA